MVELNLISGVKWFGVSCSDAISLQCLLYICLMLSVNHVVVFAKFVVLVYMFHLPWSDVLAVEEMSMTFALDQSLS